MIDARKDIRFRDEGYNTKFTIKDGDSIKITVAYDGEELVRKCRWLDEAHMNVGSTCYHMDEFMEKLTRVGNRYEPVPNPEPKLDILFVEPGQKPRDMEIPISMAALRELVGGEIDITPYGYKAAIVRGISGDGPADQSGAFAVCGFDGGKLASLHPYSAQQYKRELALREQIAADDSAKRPPVPGQFEESASPKPAAPALLDRRLTEHEFFKRMNKLLPGISPVALSNWISYVNSLDFDNKHPAEKTFLELAAEFTLVKRHYGEETAIRLFHVALEMCLNSSEIRGAANHLKNGVELNDVMDLALTGKCKRTRGEYQESRQMVKELLESVSGAKKPSISDQIAGARKATAEINGIAESGRPVPSSDRKRPGEAR